MRNAVLIVTHSTDLHADLVAPILAARGYRSFRIDLDGYPRDYQTSLMLLEQGQSGYVRHLPSGALLDLADVGAIWSRKPGDFAFPSTTLSPQEHAYARMEAEHALFSLLFSLDCYWLGHPSLLRAAMWKGEQLQRARRMGFRVPPSLITNAPEQVRLFRASIDGAMIFKSMSTPQLAAQSVAPSERVARGVRTTIIDDDMMESIGAVSELPCQFQQYIGKQYELRITIIGEHLFAARLHSQDDARTMIDSRDMSAEIRYEATLLPHEVHQRCLDFVRSYGLDFGVLDLIVTPQGDYVFLENNPVGQFLFVQQLIPEFALLETLADTLIKGAQCTPNHIPS